MSKLKILIIPMSEAFSIMNIEMTSEVASLLLIISKLEIEGRHTHIQRMEIRTLLSINDDLNIYLLDRAIDMQTTIFLEENIFEVLPKVIYIGGSFHVG